MVDFICIKFSKAVLARALQSLGFRSLLQDPLEFWEAIGAVALQHVGASALEVTEDVAGVRFVGLAAMVGDL